MATHSSVLAWEIPWTEETGGYSPWGHKSPTQLSTQINRAANTQLESDPVTVS